VKHAGRSIAATEQGCKPRSPPASGRTQHAQCGGLTSPLGRTVCGIAIYGSMLAHGHTADVYDPGLCRQTGMGLHQYAARVQSRQNMLI
jgi:hypothetical protein